MYAGGFGVPQDQGQALHWYRLAADQGLPQAQYEMGRIYQLGLGVPRDYALAAQWHRRAADQGIADGQASMGYLYEQGHGVAQDLAQAATWYRRALETEPGHALAQEGLGRLRRARPTPATRARN
jgi:TPR repeat protein